MKLHPTLVAQLQRCGLSADTVEHEAAWSELLRTVDETYRRLEPGNTDAPEAEIVAAKLDAEAARLAAQAKSDFLANMSHEIRTPMTAILGYVDMLAEEEPSPTECRQFHDIIRRNGEHLLALLNDILDLSKFEAGSMEVDPSTFPIMEVVHDVTLIMAQRARSAGLDFGVKIETPLPPTVQTDVTRLRQILLNLVGNAIRFTAEGSVEVRVSADPDRKTVRVAVVDTGIGMSPEQTRTVFRAFTQADETIARRFGGTGLGLAISERLTQLLGGELTVESVVDQGSTFTLELPIGTRGASGEGADTEVANATPSAQENAAATEAASAPRAAAVRILLAEDVEDSRRWFVRVLESAGHEVTAVDNGALARDVALEAEAEGRPFDLIFMDMKLPVLDGYDTTRLLRQAGYSRRIIALTAHAMEGDREKCLASGCDDYSPKPVRRHAVDALIAKWTSQTPA